MATRRFPHRLRGRPGSLRLPSKRRASLDLHLVAASSLQRGGLRSLDPVLRIRDNIKIVERQRFIGRHHDSPRKQRTGRYLTCRLPASNILTLHPSKPRRPIWPSQRLSNQRHHDSSIGFIGSSVVESVDVSQLRWWCWWCGTNEGPG